MSVQSDTKTVRDALQSAKDMCMTGAGMAVGDNALAALDRIAASHEAAMDALEEIDGHLFEKQDASRCRELARAALARAREGR